MLSRRRFARKGPYCLLLLALATVGLVVGASESPSAHAAGSDPPGVAALRIGSNDMANPGDLSQYRYVIMQASEWARIPALKAANPRVKVIAYEDMSLSTAWSCTNGVDDAFPASGLGYCASSTSHPSWFLTDTSGQRVMSAWYSGDWFMDIGSTAYQNAWAAAVVSMLRTKGFDGVMLDDANSDPTGPLGGRTLAKYPTPQSYADATSGFLQNVCGQVRAAGFLTLPNVQASSSRAVRDQWAGYCDGTVKEYWVKWGSSTNLQKTGADWADDLAQLEDADAAGKIMIPIVYTPMNDERDMTFARASFLLAWNGSSSSALIRDVPGATPWSSAWTASVGSPLGPRRQVVGGVWRRDFTGGTVLVNPDPASTVTVPLGGTYTDASGASVTSVTLGPASGSILAGQVRAPTTAPAPVAPPVASPPVGPPPPPARPLVPSTIGMTDAGTSLTVAQPAETKYVNSVTLAASGTLTKIRAYVSGAGGANTEALRGVVYDDAGGAPGALRGTTTTVWVAGTAHAGWVDIAFASPLPLAAGRYWLGLQFGGWSGLVRIGFTAGPNGTGRYNADAWGDGPSTAFGDAAQDHEVWAVNAVVSISAPKRSLFDHHVAPTALMHRIRAYRH